MFFVFNIGISSFITVIVRFKIVSEASDIMDSGIMCEKLCEIFWEDYAGKNANYAQNYV